MPKLADWVKETVSGTPGTGTITLGGAVTGFCRFQDQFTTGDVVKYLVQDVDNKEEGIGTLTTGTPWTLARTIVKQTINAGTFDNTSPAALTLTSSAIVGISGSADTTGIVVGTALATLSSVVTCTTVMPIDNTKPQNTEGTEVITLAYAPKFSDSILQIEAFTYIAHAQATGALWICGALFVDSAADAISSTYFGDTVSSASNHYIRVPLHLYYEVVSGNTTSRTYKLRCGPHSTGTVYANGDGIGAAIFNGTSTAYLKITEIRQ